MKALNCRSSRRTLAALMLALAACSGLVLQAAYQPAWAQQGEKKTRKTPAAREQVFKKLTEAQEAAEAGDTAKALKVLEALRQDQSLNEYERALTWSFLAYIYASQERYADALRAFNEVLKQPNLPEAMEQQSLFSIAQMHLALDQPREAIKAIERWFKVAPEPTTQAYVVWAQACYLAEDYRCTARQAENAIALARKQGSLPQESWLLMLRAAYYELGNIPKVIEVLEQLVKLYPKGDYFYQLSAMYGEQDDEKRQLAVLEAAYDGGYFSRSSEYVTLASLLLNNGVPYKAAKVLEEGMKNKIVERSVSHLRLLAQAYLFAQEPEASARVLAEAAKKSDDGELYVRLGQAYMSMDRWDDCADAIQEGLKKGGIKREGSALVTLGICRFNKDDLDGSIAAFKLAQKHKDTKDFADRWLEYLRNEKARQAQIAESLG
ncbi:MAG: hypothetical protein KatS3mg121_0439 [Gammaproteobacteria bacterium]|nr:MAG: hypothetical protein KatS3mg121_0439 [Gammaproteobacteria bacterium]